MAGPGPQAQVVPLHARTLARLHPLTAKSVFWEVDPLNASFQDTVSEMDKGAWLAARAEEQDTVGFSIAEAASTRGALATVLYCPAKHAPGAVRMPTAPVSVGAWLVTSLHIDTIARNRGWESVLLDSAIMAATGAGAEALEVFGVRPDGTASSDSAASLRRSAAQIGLVEVSLLESAGFMVVRDHDVIPRLRLELPPAHELLSAREVESLLAGVPLA